MLNIRHKEVSMNNKTNTKVPAKKTATEKPVLDPSDTSWKCTHSPDGYHEPQKQSTIAACRFCGKVI